jgi:6-phosphofructokinase 1
MNAAIRAVVRATLTVGGEACGVRHGYQGLVEGDIHPLSARRVGGIIARGGTLLGTARSPEFAREDVRREAIRQLRLSKVDGLVVVGGNGSQAGAWALSKLGFPVVGVSSTIDNDLYGADISIGVDTALDVALESIDRLKTTAMSHGRVFVIEVMGRDSGYLAMAVGVAGGADAVVIPEEPVNPEDLAEVVRAAYHRGKNHAIVVVAEGAEYNAERLVHFFREHRERLGFEVRATTLGHVQRGGAPGAFDRLLATRLGAAAVDLLVAGKHGVMVGLRGNEIVPTPLEEVATRKRVNDLSLYHLAGRLAF